MNKSGERQSLFPLVRHFSTPLSRALARAPLTPNDITLISLLAGLTAAVCAASVDFYRSLIGGLLLVMSYVLDNCDGEIARLRNLSSRFGAWFETVADWLVHAALFLGLGLGVRTATGEAEWLWLGVAAAGGATINYRLGLCLDARVGEASGPANDGLRGPDGDCSFKDRAIFFLRELSRADFCFLFLALSLVQLTWVLLPAAAVGAQVYWLAQFMDGARNYHV